jgi:hypothetical protein
MKIPAVFTLSIMLCTGCITSSLSRSNMEYLNVKREFTLGLQRDCKVYRGVWGGTREIHGETCRLFQFPGVLKGEGRLLEVLVPLKETASPEGGRRELKSARVRDGELYFGESPAGIDGGHPAYLLVQVLDRFDNNSSSGALAGQKIGTRSDPVALLKEQFGQEISDPRYPLVLVSLDAKGTDEYRARCLVWDRIDDGVAVVTYAGTDRDRYNGPRMGIGWRERSRPVYALRRAGYAGTILADIATSPAQLVWLLWLVLYLDSR